MEFNQGIESFHIVSEECKNLTDDYIILIISKCPLLR